MALIQSERYEIDPTPIGRGGFGEVYRARDLLFDRDVVIKTIVASQLYGIDDARIRRQFFKESAISAKLGQLTDYIVKVYDFGYDRDTSEPFFVMEFVEGHDLTRSIGALPILDAARLFDQILCALQVAHSKGVVHSDISPDNIMLELATGFYKLNDFGLARLLNSTLMRRGSLKSLVGGKPGFLPPGEFQTGDRSPYSDLYGLAATLVQLVLGRIPVWAFSDGSYTLEPLVDNLGQRMHEGPDPIILDVGSYSKSGSFFEQVVDRGSLSRIVIEPRGLFHMWDAILQHRITQLTDLKHYLHRRVIMDAKSSGEDENGSARRSSPRARKRQSPKKAATE